MLADKPWFKSLTLWGLAIFGAAESLCAALGCASMQCAPAQLAMACKVVSMIGLILAGLGIRRAVGAQAAPPVTDLASAVVELKKP